MAITFSCPHPTCKSTNTKMTWEFPPYRLLALYALPDDMHWKMCLLQTHQTTNDVKAYEASATCNEFTDDDHYVYPLHISIETKQRNSNRKNEHNGTRSSHRLSRTCVKKDSRRLQLPGPSVWAGRGGEHCPSISARLRTAKVVLENHLG